MESIAISFYDETGRITASLTAPRSDIELNKRMAPRWVIGDWYEKNVYVKNGVVTKRPQNPAQMVGTQLVSLPTPCEIHINNKTYPCAESTATLEFTQPGTYKVRVEAWPYLDKEFTVENPA